jgi:hypothetical protein
MAGRDSISLKCVIIVSDLFSPEADDEADLLDMRRDGQGDFLFLTPGLSTGWPCGPATFCML